MLPPPSPPPFIWLSPCIQGVGGCATAQKPENDTFHSWVVGKTEPVYKPFFLFIFTLNIYLGLKLPKSTNFNWLHWRGFPYSCVFMYTVKKGYREKGKARKIEVGKPIGRKLLELHCIHVTLKKKHSKWRKLYNFCRFFLSLYFSPSWSLYPIVFLKQRCKLHC